MASFPRTTVGGVSVPRLICGTNWFLGYSHTSAAKDKFIQEYFTRERIATVLGAWLKHGVDAVMGPASQLLADAISDAEQKAGRKMLYICTPGEKDGIGWAKAHGATFCFPHQCVTDSFLDRRKKNISGIEPWLKEIRAAGMIPGLSTHMPETVPIADATGLDVESYLQIYNAAGFLCQVETDWVGQIIRSAEKPVMVIKPLGAGRILPPTGLSFVWSTIRPVDMVVIGVMSAYEVEEDVELSLAALEGRQAHVSLQRTRSKGALVYRAPECTS